MEIAEKGLEQTVRDNPAIARGVHTHQGWITNEDLANKLGSPFSYMPFEEVIGD
jgi:alanine dehydrogenase